MLLHDDLTRYRHQKSIKMVDWLFGLIGFFFLMLALPYFLFSPDKMIEVAYNHRMVPLNISLFLTLLSILFFTIGGIYALMNRVWKIATDYKMGIIHLILTVAAILIFFIRVESHNVYAQLSISDLVNSMLSLGMLLLFAQFIFLTNAVSSIFNWMGR